MRTAWRVTKARRERLRDLEADVEAHISLCCGLVPESLEAMTSEERNQHYRMLRIDIRVHVNGAMEIVGTVRVCNSHSIP
jgi:hypothetical protein